MLKLFLDEHISPSVGEGLRRKSKALEVHWLAEWRKGELIGAEDQVCLSEAEAHGLVLVTYDLRTIPPLLKSWAEAGRAHGGVVFVDGKTIPPSDIGGLIRKLHELWEETRDWDWLNRIYFLRK